MAGYYDTYLQGLQRMAPMMMNQRRMSETEAWHRAQLGRQYDQMLMQMMMRDSSDRRLEAALQEQIRHHGALEKSQGQNLEARLLALSNQINRGNFDVVEDRDGVKWAYDKNRNTVSPLGGGNAQRPRGQGASTGPGPQPMTFNPSRPLPQSERNKLQSMAKDYQSFLALAKSFKPGYVNPFGETVGDMEVSLRGHPMVPMDSGMANWWRDYRALAQNPERHALYGSNLPRHEMQLYNQSNIHPGMRPKDLMETYAVRLALQKSALDRAARAAADRFNRKEIENSTGIPVPDSVPVGSPPSREEFASRGMRLIKPLEELLGGTGSTE